MKAFIVEVIVPDSWVTVDVVCGVNIGLRDYFRTQSQTSPILTETHRVLEDPRGLRTSTTVLAELPLR